MLDRNGPSGQQFESHGRLGSNFSILACLIMRIDESLLENLSRLTQAAIHTDFLAGFFFLISKKSRKLKHLLLALLLIFRVKPTLIIFESIWCQIIGIRRVLALQYHLCACMFLGNGQLQSLPYLRNLCHTAILSVHIVVFHLKENRWMVGLLRGVFLLGGRWVINIVV
jgi:hypothetical protein